ncbi:SAM-dependent methyltransferase [Saccharothrix sp. AJ9571]|nr:SAM-dependent methyltransferase [Saccharothrix sp. AJ9571]
MNPEQLAPQSLAYSPKATAAGVANLGKGGICNYRADREWRQYRQALWPEFGTYDLAATHSSVEVVEAALDAGITRFLDLGAGFPDDTCLAKIARRRFPAARVTAVDNDVMIARTWATALTSKHTSCDATSFFHGDFAEPAAVLGHARAHRTLDPHEPVCIVLTDVLHHLGDHLPLRQIIGTYQEAVPAGSLLAISHLTTDGASARQLEQIDELAAAYGDIGEPLRPRTRTEVTALFGTWALRDPGVVSQRPADTPPGELGAIRWAGVAVKPA